MMSNKESGCNLINQGNSTENLWHIRLGHVSNKRIAHVAKISHHINISSNDLVCNVCHFGKWKCFPFSEHTKSTGVQFEFVHFDVWGPFPHETHDVYCFFLTILDDHTRVYLIKCKLDVPKIVEQFINF